MIFSQAVDCEIEKRVPTHLRDLAQQEAVQLGYMTPHERNTVTRELNALGLCRHVIEMNCCPAGCD